MADKKTEYELMQILHSESNPPWFHGIDSESVALDGALGIIKWLLRNDEAVKGYKMVKKPSKRRKTST